jgi:hypothetical protein
MEAGGCASSWFAISSPPHQAITEMAIGRTDNGAGGPHVATNAGAPHVRMAAKRSALESGLMETLAIDTQPAVRKAN